MGEGEDGATGFEAVDEEGAGAGTGFGWQVQVVALQAWPDGQTVPVQTS